MVVLSEYAESAKKWTRLLTVVTTTVFIQHISEFLRPVDIIDMNRISHHHDYFQIQNIERTPCVFPPKDCKRSVY
jgi:hypothetical protein